MAKGRRARGRGTPRRSQDHTERAYRGIRQMLFFNEITPGQKLHYRDLAERLGMSPTPVAQALKLLEFQGLVRHEPNRGYYLEPVRLEEVREVYDLRACMEVALLPDVIAGLDDGGAETLQQAFECHAAATRERYLKRRLLADMELHLTFATVAGRPLARRMLRQLFDRLYLKYRAEILFYRPMETAEAEHRVILDRVLARDLDGAREAMECHIRNVRDHVLDDIQRNLEEKSTIVF